MPDLSHLLENNRSWARGITERDPEFFQSLAKQQSPRYLWIGCSDSRVPANEITGLKPGEVFVHRNIANVVVHTDLNCLSVMQYAVDVLKVEHIIVCGHYGCGGVNAALRRKNVGLVDNWLRHVEDVYLKHARWIDAIPELELQSDRLCEVNAIEQAINVCQTTVVRDAWLLSQPLSVHAWTYGLKDGLISELGVTIASEADVALSYKRALTKMGAPALSPLIP
jgi:carbonic anhydrase